MTESDTRTASLRPLFFPRSVAVVGASRDPSSVGHRIVTALAAGGFQGPIYPINPKADSIASFPAYPGLAELGRPVDMAVVAVPAPAVEAVVDQCGQAGVKALVVISAGYAEVGPEGQARQKALLEQVRGHGMRMVGPNCLGVMHTHADVRLNASFAQELPPQGTVALCSQSGALGVAVVALANRIGLGMSGFVSIGNKADVSGNDLLEYWEGDEGTDVVLFYLESFGDPRRFSRLARRVSRSKPIVVVKAGRSEAGSRAASSHTAALASPDAAVESLVQQAGVIRADTLEEMFDIARTLVDQPLPAGGRVGLVTNAGGPGILCVDALESMGMEVRELGEDTQAALQAFLPKEASVRNPVDMIASAGPDQYREAIATLLASPEIDALVVLHTPVGLYPEGAMERAVAEGVDEGRRRGGVDKPVFASLVGSEGDVYTISSPAGERIPVFLFPEEIAATLDKIVGYSAWRGSEPGTYVDPDGMDHDRAAAICRRALEERGEGWLSVGETRDVLAAAGITTTPGGVARDEDEAVAFADAVGYPVALKLASITIVHKTDVGGVRLGMEGPDAVRDAFREIRATLEGLGRVDEMEGVLVQPMLAGAAETMIGAQADRAFGHLIAFGLGGIHVEILRDVSFRVAPLTDRDAREMVHGIRGVRLLEGYRGYPAADLDALQDALVRISRLVEAVPTIQELDLNPIFALRPGEGYRVADARMRVGG